jgi:Ca-activated chloride channel homolog
MTRLRPLPRAPFLALTLAFAILPSLAQDGSQAFNSAVGLSSAEAQFTISSRVDEVNLVFTVTDSKGHFLNKLESKDFQFLDNHLPPAQIKYFQQQTDLPLRVGLLIDASSSIKSRFAFEQKAASTFLKNILRPGTDQAFVIGFDSTVHLEQDFTSNLGALQSAVHKLRPGGETVLYDALMFATNRLHSADESSVTRRIIILITDGADTKSCAIMYDVQQAAIRTGAVIYALSTNALQRGEYPPGEAVLELLTKASGGRILPARESSQLTRAFADVEKALRSQYALGYKPDGLQLDGGFRPVEIVPAKRDLKVQCRRGYYSARQ